MVMDGGMARELARLRYRPRLRTSPRRPRVVVCSRSGSRWKPLGLGMLSVLLLSVSGCGWGGGDAPQASINASKSGSGKSARPPQDFLHPKVLIETSLGNVTLQLDAEKAPLTVDNFLSYADRGHYDQTIVHQIVKGQIILAGGFDAQLKEKKARTPVRNEAHNGLKNVRGTIAMARKPDAVDSATCQFYFNLADNAWLDHKDRTADGYGYCVFGRVVGGQEVLDQIAAVPVQNTEQFEGIPTQPVLIRSVRRTQ